MTLPNTYSPSHAAPPLTPSPAPVDVICSLIDILNTSQQILLSSRKTNSSAQARHGGSSRRNSQATCRSGEENRPPASRTSRPTPPPANTNLHRLQILRAIEKQKMDPVDRTNIEAVIRDYETGNLDLTKREDPDHCAIFWNGELKRGWGSLDDGYLRAMPKAWKQAQPNARLWVEEGELDGPSHLATSYEFDA
ncbi:hypothetical protein BJ508DRAFT_347315 [Ascobolus immersus RN42]|uniref:Uncharacterized protein n=1 Tax=Ascobolus immersus RN42 TaxID=1160509 RepID=A0A3N4I283_ASCIM|nr:hypothetical protein BJ508DRAFT_347315 [Ascobolus immersus RN42]